MSEIEKLLPVDATACSRLARCGCGRDPKIKYDSITDRGDHGNDHVTWVECICGMQTRKLHWHILARVHRPDAKDGSEKAVAIWNQCLSANANLPTPNEGGTNLSGHAS